MKRLFTDSDKHTPEAHNLDTTVALAVKDIFKYYVEQGFSIRDIEYIMQHAISDIALDHLLRLDFHDK